MLAVSDRGKTRGLWCVMPAPYLEKIDQDHRPRAPASPPKTLDVGSITPASGLGAFDLTVAQRFSGSIAISSAHVAPYHDLS